MFGLIRRLSHSVIPRPDRPWEDDPTSIAPHKPRKRRLSTSEQDDAISNGHASLGREGYVGESASKRARGEGALASGDADEFGAWSPMPQVRTDQTSPEPGVKEVTQGVKEVDLEDKDEVEDKDKVVEDKDEVVENKDELEDDASSAGIEEQPQPAKDVEPESVPLPDEDEVDELDDDDGDNSQDAVADPEDAE
ncbi:hypothetical protein AX14_005970 [Amanita brunnescens Koide BX004]|nr:hypothetical protein AX14_005970 [Amanita brunnescens Koide BX004]